MTELSLSLDPLTLEFYQRVADLAGLPLRQVLADALFLLAGNLAETAIH